MTTVPQKTSATLYGTAVWLLNTTVFCLQGQLLSVPTRQVVYMGTIPADCEQVAVVFGGWTPSPPPEGMTKCADYRWTGGFTIIVTRKCSPIVGDRGGPPSAEQMSTAAAVSSADAEALLCVVNQIGEHGGELAVTCDPPFGGLQTTSLVVSIPSTEMIWG